MKKIMLFVWAAAIAAGSVPAYAQMIPRPIDGARIVTATNPVVTFTHERDVRGVIMGERQPNGTVVRTVMIESPTEQLRGVIMGERTPEVGIIVHGPNPGQVSGVIMGERTPVSGVVLRNQATGGATAIVLHGRSASAAVVGETMNALAPTSALSALRDGTTQLSAPRPETRGVADSQVVTLARAAIRVIETSVGAFPDGMNLLCAANGALLLEGTVANLDQKKKIETALRGMTGVKAVQNRLQVL